MKRIIKSIGWSYPTSPNASRFKFKNGCWTVALTTVSDTGASTQHIAGYATEAEALAHAEELPNPWAMWAPQRLELARRDAMNDADLAAEQKRERQARPLTGTAGEFGTRDMLDSTAGQMSLFNQ